jgi:hypothetical protein
MALKKIDEYKEVTLHNCSAQMLSLQLSETGADFYQQQQAHLQSGKTLSIPTRYLLAPQVNNLMARGMLRLAAGK